MDRLLADLEAYKNKEDLSWDDVAKMVSVPKRTILRWRKERKIGRAYFRLLSGILPRIRAKHYHLKRILKKPFDDLDESESV